jgi:hypothetical protein
VDETPTQARYPWRATLRTVIAAIVGLALIAPAVIDELGLGDIGWIAAAVGAIGAVTRVLAMPVVVDWMRDHRITSWLAPDPPERGTAGGSGKAYRVPPWR